MNRVILTDKKLQTLKPARPGSRYDLLDALMPGLLVRVTDQGGKTFHLRAKYPGNKTYVRRALGKVNVLTVEAARTKARAWHALLERGIDPDAQTREDRLAALRSSQHTFRVVSEAYFAHIELEGFKKAKTHAREIRKEFGLWNARSIHDITQEDLAAVINSIKARGSPGQAREMLMRAKALWRWAIGCGAYGLTSSPADRLGTSALVGSKKSRTRVLSDAELRALWNAVEAESYPWQPLYKLLAMTGQRLSDVANSTWPEFDQDKRLWTIPPNVTRPVSRRSCRLRKRCRRCSTHCRALTAGNSCSLRPGVARQSPTSRSPSAASMRAWRRRCRAARLGRARHSAHRAFAPVGAASRAARA